MRKFATLAAFATLSLGVGMGLAHAQGAGPGAMPNLYGGMMMMISPDGHMQTMKMTDPKMKSMMSDMMMKNGQTMTAPMMIMMGSDGKMHMMPDAMMSDGKMMSQHMQP